VHGHGVNDGTFGNNLTAESLKPIFDTAMENGLNNRPDEAMIKKWLDEVL